MRFKGFSPKQKLVLTWWMPGGRFADLEGIICDGAVRSGKTLSMGLGFFLWSMAQFDGRRFGVCGKTIASVRRNVLAELLPRLEAMGFRAREKRSENRLELRFGGHTNEYYLFGGRDELLGYGFFALLRREDGVHYLFDYLAIVPERRDSGIGTEFLLRLPREIPDAASILGEVENPDLESDPAEQAVKQRRLQFYLRSGIQETGVLSRLFGVDYRVMEFPVCRQHSPEEIQALYRDFYRSFLPKPVFDRMVRVELAP